jgi:hypothetical protein
MLGKARKNFLKTPIGTVMNTNRYYKDKCSLKHK